MLFAKISVDTTLPKKRKHGGQDPVENLDDPAVVDTHNPAANKVTVYHIYNICSGMLQ